MQRDLSGLQQREHIGNDTTVKANFGLVKCDPQEAKIFFSRHHRCNNSFKIQKNINPTPKTM